VVADCPSVNICWGGDVLPAVGGVDIETDFQILLIVKKPKPCPMKKSAPTPSEQELFYAAKNARRERWRQVRAAMGAAVGKICDVIPTICIGCLVAIAILFFGLVGLTVAIDRHPKLKAIDQRLDRVEMDVESLSHSLKIGDENVERMLTNGSFLLDNYRYLSLRVEELEEGQTSRSNQWIKAESARAETLTVLQNHKAVVEELMQRVALLESRQATNWTPAIKP
jgi:hypothetical protein